MQASRGMLMRVFVRVRTPSLGWNAGASLKGAVPRRRVRACIAR